jgi:hypothetical protein
VRDDGPASQVLPTFTTEMEKIGAQDADTDLSS